MQPTQRDRTEDDAVRPGQAMAADPQQRRRDQGREEGCDRAGSKGTTKLPIKSPLGEPTELQSSRPTDDRQPGLPRKPRRGLRIEPKRTGGGDRGAIPRDTRAQRSRLGNADVKGV